MKMLDCFAGIGGFTYAAQRIWGHRLQTHAFIEQDLYCAYILSKHYPDIPICRDIRGYYHNGTAIDLLTAGWPCQPVSQTGKRRGAEDDRWIWPEVVGLIQATRPKWFVGENVAGIIQMELDQVLADLEDCGYTCWTFIIPAAAVDAYHRRDRVWIIAHTAEVRLEEIEAAWLYGQWRAGQFLTGLPLADRLCQCVEELRATGQSESCAQVAAEIFGCAHQGDQPVRWEPEPGLARLVHGVPPDVHRFTALGNAIVPQVAEVIFEAIKEVDQWVGMPTLP